MPRGLCAKTIRSAQSTPGVRGATAMTDRELLQRFREQHEQSAFAELMQRHGPMVLRVCQRVLHHAQDAEDAFQATFLILASKAASVRRTDSVASWLHGVARRIAVRARLRPDGRTRPTSARGVCPTRV